jgi:hypothetical protein
MKYNIKDAAHEYFIKGQIHLGPCDSENAFKAGVEFAQRWISVKEKLPPVNGYGFSDRVITKKSNGAIFIEKINIANMAGIKFWRPIEYK